MLRHAKDVKPLFCNQPSKCITATYLLLCISFMNNSQTKSSGNNKIQRRLIVSMSLSGSLWLAVRLSLALSGSLWLSLARCPALSGSLWLAVWLSLDISGSLWLSQALYCSPNLLTKPLLSSQGPCSARNAVPEFPHFNQPCQSVIRVLSECYQRVVRGLSKCYQRVISL